jgi:hypothetical protein
MVSSVDTMVHGVPGLVDQLVDQHLRDCCAVRAGNETAVL